MRTNPYLMFDGQCKTAFEFYAKCLGGRIEMMQTHGESPAKDHTPREWHDKIIHARLTAEDVVLMGSDAPPGHQEKPQGMWVSLDVDKPADAQRIFSALADRGQVKMPFGQTFWAAGGFGMVVDRFGTPWMVNCNTAA
jgi:PhnB protein